MLALRSGSSCASAPTGATTARDALPDYDQGRLGANQNFFNNSWTLTIGPAEGAGLIVIGRQDSAPAIDLHLVLK